MALFNKEEKKNQDSIVEAEEFEYIDLDETAGWSKLEVADRLAKQQAKEMLEEIGEELAEVDSEAEEVVLEYLGESPAEKESNKTEQEKALLQKDAIAEEIKKESVEREVLTEEDVEYLSLEDEEEEEDEDDEDDESPFAFFENLADFFSGWTVMDKVVALTGVLVMIVAIFTVSAYAGNRGVSKQISAFAPIGEQLELLGKNGQDKLWSVAEAKKEMFENGKLEEELNQEYIENELDSQVQVQMKLNSVQKDLKVKFVNKKTGKLVGNVAFEIEIVDPDNRKYSKIDEDKDGIIYLADITPGNYTISMAELADMDGYSFSGGKESIKVKEKIEYAKIDVSDEIKNQNEIDVSKEDTAQKTQTEGTLQDTVEWVESTKTEVSGEEKFVEVDKGSIADPSLSASLTLDLSILRILRESVLLTSQIADTVSENDSQQENISVTGLALSTTELSLAVEGSSVLSVTIIPLNASNQEVVWSSDNSQVATVENGVVKAVGAGTANIVVTSKDNTSKSATCKVTVTGPIKEEEKEEDKKEENGTTIKLDQTAVTLKVGESLKLKAEVMPEEKTVTWESSKEQVATVNKNGKVVAVAEGETEIKATVDGKSVVCKVTVIKEEAKKEDNTKPLKDKNGNQMYIQKEGKYVEATVADYYNYKKFYKKEGSAQYKYTGWQDLDGKTYYFDKNGNKVTGEQVIQGAKYSFNSDGSLNTGSGSLGIDVSTWNGTIDWNKVKNAGVSYVIIRTGFRGSTQGSLVEDNKFRQNIQGATSAGLKVGVYFFSQAVNEVEAVEEASMVLSQVKGYNLAYPVFIDVEPSGGRADKIDVGTRTKVVNAFCQTIQNSGYKAGIYANKTWFTEKLNTSALSGYKIWLAQYNTHVTYSGRYDMWQYSEKGKVNGISGNVDMNLSYLAY